MFAQASQLISAATIKWSGGSNFNGYAILTMVIPSYGAIQGTKVALKDNDPVLFVPQQVKVLIREGVYDPETMVWRTDYLTPPNVEYSVVFYDDTDTLIASGVGSFAVTASPYILAPPTLTEPS